MTRFRLLLAFAVLMFVPLLTVRAQSPYYTDALLNYQQGNLSEARALLSREIESNPDNDAAYYYSALAIMAGANPGDADVAIAERMFKKAIELSPDNYWYKYYLAMFYADTERMELTSMLLEELIAAYPKKQELYFNAANAYLSQKDIDKALATLDKIETLSGKNEMIGLTKMDLMSKKGDMTQGQIFGFLEQYYEDCPTPRIATTLGDYYQGIYKDSLALRYYSKAIELDDSYSPAYFGRAHVYQALRNYDAYFSDIRVFLSDPTLRPEAKAEYLSNVMDNPQFVSAFLSDVDTMMMCARQSSPVDSSMNTIVGVYYYRTERVDEGLAILKDNMEQFSSSYGAAFQYLLTLYYCKRWNEVVNVASGMLMQYPSDHDILQLRGIALWQDGNLESAIEDYLRMEALAPRDSANIVNAGTALGDLYHLSGNSKMSYKYYQKVLKVAPQYVPVLNNYAYYLSIEGKDLKKARKMSRITIEKEPDNPTYLDTYAWILHLMGDDLEAKAIFKHAMLYGAKENATILDHYAEVLFSLKEYDLAFIYWRQADVADPSLNLGDKIKQRKTEAKR